MTKHQVAFPIAGILICAATLIPQSARAAAFADPANDFLSGYLGTQGADLDVRAGEVIYDGAFFIFSSTSNGNIGLTPGAFYVWGINRGAGTARFGALATGVLFDSVVILTPGGDSSVRDLIGNVTTPLNPAALTINGTSLSARVSATLLPTQGFAAQNYTVNLWPRLAGGNNMIADFAPDNSNALVTATPEPATAGLLAGALLCLGAVVRRRTAR